MFTHSGCKDIGNKKFEFVAKTQFLYGTVSVIRVKYTSILKKVCPIQKGTFNTLSI